MTGNSFVHANGPRIHRGRAPEVTEIRRRLRYVTNAVLFQAQGRFAAKASAIFPAAVLETSPAHRLRVRLRRLTPAASELSILRARSPSCAGVRECRRDFAPKRWRTVRADCRGSPRLAAGSTECFRCA